VASTGADGEIAGGLSVLSSGAAALE